MQRTVIFAILAAFCLAGCARPAPERPLPTSVGAAPLADVPATLRQSGADVVVSYLPVGSEEADKFYAQAAIDAGATHLRVGSAILGSRPPHA